MRSRYVARMPLVEARSTARCSNVENVPRRRPASHAHFPYTPRNFENAPVTCLPPGGWLNGHLQADCLYTGISSGPNARYRVWEAFTFTFYPITCQQRVQTPPSVCTMSSYRGMDAIL